jgi:Leucine-rich repeat (LRR) protein
LLLHHVFEERKHRTHVVFSGSELRKMPFESRTKLWTLVWFAAALSVAAAPCVCPEECTCDLQEGSIDCSNRSLRTIPVTLNCAWPNVTKINLKQNQITHVPGYAFSEVTQLERLYLYENLIETIDQNAFHSLTQLRYLYLDDNRLRSLPDEVFYPVRNLYSLLLYSNQISHLPVNVFSTLGNLFRLALHDNALTILDARSFNGLINLEELLVSYTLTL